MNDSSGQVEGQAAPDTTPAGSTAAESSPAEFGELPAIAAGGDGQLNLDLIMDVNLSLTLEVGRTKISVRNLLALTQGSVVELDKLAGEPLDVLVNGTLVAHGEVVTVNEKFGIRLLDVVSAEKRVESLTE